jgi:hypothetical protein
MHSHALSGRQPTAEAGTIYQVGLKGSWLVGTSGIKQLAQECIVLVY